MISRRQAIAGAVVAPAFLAALAGHAAPVPPTIGEFLKPPVDRDVALSPDGKRIAILSAVTDGELVTASISVLDADDPARVLATLPVGNADVRGLIWGNNERLLVRLTVYPDQVNRPPAGTYSTANKRGYPVGRVVSVGIDGKGTVTLFDDGTRKLRQIYDLSDIVDVLRDDPGHVLVQAWSAGLGVWALYKANIYDGSVEMVERGGVNTFAWQTQNGVPLVRYDADGQAMAIFIRAPDQKDWVFYRKVRRKDLEKLDFEIVAATETAGTMLAVAAADGHDTRVLRKFDTRSLALGEVVASRPDRDIDGAVITPEGVVLAAIYTEDRQAYVFSDPKMAAHFRGLNKYLGDECNISLVQGSADLSRFLAFVQGPREPGAYYFYDRAARRFDSIGQLQPWLTQERLAPVEILGVKARDGVMLTAYLTIPLASSPRPLIVMPHGGPELRDRVDFDRFAQIFAAQGWMVLQPNFRGSGGYGQAFAKAGKKHWGDLMQADVEDAVAQVLASGRVDTTRIAICGASYGGYAALMGAVRRPELYKAVVAIAGDSDLVESIAFSRSKDGADSEAYRYWLGSIGNPETDRAMMEAASPARQASRIQAPVLLIHGTEDRIVAPKQSRIMAQALKAAGKPVELVELPDVGHRNLDVDDWKLVYTKSVAHIARAFSA